MGGQEFGLMSSMSGGGGQGPLPPNIHLPDFSKPPPGFPPTGAGGFNSLLPGPPSHLLPQPAPPLMEAADLMPSMPYFDLPAGLMAPLVKVSNCCPTIFDDSFMVEFIRHLTQIHKLGILAWVGQYQSCIVYPAASFIQI